VCVCVCVLHITASKKIRKTLYIAFLMRLDHNNIMEISSECSLL